MYVCEYISECIYCYCYFGEILPSHPWMYSCRNLDEVFTYNHSLISIMSLRNRSHVMASMVLTRADFIYVQLIKITSK